MPSAFRWGRAWAQGLRIAVKSDVPLAMRADARRMAGRVRVCGKGASKNDEAVPAAFCLPRTAGRRETARRSEAARWNCLLVDKPLDAVDGWMKRRPWLTFGALPGRR